MVKNKTVIIILVAAVILMFLISACQDGIIGSKKGKRLKGDRVGGGGEGELLDPCVDYDNDGYSHQQPTCPAPLGLDCDDGDPLVNPDGIEICNGIYDYQDDNCNGLLDEGITGPGCCVDNDGDRCGDNCRWNNIIYWINSEPCDWDCDDNDINVYPGNREVCGDGKDNDCDGLIDETELEWKGTLQVPGCVTECLDGDGDGYGDGCVLGPDCPNGKYSANHYPSAVDICGDEFGDTNCDGIDGSVEVCDGIDNDCDGFVDTDEDAPVGHSVFKCNFGQCVSKCVHTGENGSVCVENCQYCKNKVDVCSKHTKK